MFASSTSLVFMLLAAYVLMVSSEKLEVEMVSNPNYASITHLTTVVLYIVTRK